MNINIDDLIEIEGVKYIVLEKELFNNSEYIFVNELTESEENTTDFYVMKQDGSNLVKELDATILKELLPIFDIKIQKLVDSVRNNKGVVE